MVGSMVPEVGKEADFGLIVKGSRLTRPAS